MGDHLGARHVAEHPLLADGQRHHVPVTRSRKIILSSLVVAALAVYVVEGVGYERLSQSCHDSRHLNDPERGQEIGGPAPAVLLWPLFLPFRGEGCDPASG